MKQYHKGMRISEKDWEIFTGRLEATLKNKLPDRQCKETVACFESTTKDIVE